MLTCGVCGAQVAHVRLVRVARGTGYALRVRTVWACDECDARAHKADGKAFVIPRREDDGDQSR
jgi:hypothetical protein